MTARPKDLKLADERHLQIEWEDGKCYRLKLSDLREQCPCATCREKRSEEPAPTNELTVLSLAETQPVRILSMNPVGNYAYSIDFSDGHNNGIFTLDFMRFLCEKLGEETNVE